MTRVIAVATPQDKPGASTIPFPGTASWDSLRLNDPLDQGTFPDAVETFAANAALTARNFHAKL